MNGCCYGGLCTLPLAVQFPQGVAPQYTPPYVRHLENGAFYGLLFVQDEEGQVIVANVLPESSASKTGKIEVGDVVESIDGYPLQGQPYAPLEVLKNRFLASWMKEDPKQGTLEIKLADKGDVALHVDEMPKASLPIHPTQVYSSLNGLILCLLVLAYYPFRKVDGEVIALTLGLYSIARFLLEVIRTDEYAIGGTGLTISQNVSVVILLLSIVLFVYARLRKQRVLWLVEGNPRMPIPIPAPSVIEAAGNKPKIIQEFIGRVNSQTDDVSIARMISPSGWVEPGQTPEFDEYTLVLKGELTVESKEGVHVVSAGQAIIVKKGEWVRYSSPHSDGAEYVAICLPAFSPETVNREDAEDVVQESFVQAYLKLGTFQGNSAFYTWLYRISFNIAISHRRRRKKVHSIDQVREEVGSEPID
ncbi:ybeY, partial [Symbiodinium microadriaticum]